MKLVLLESVFQYESNGTNYVQCNKDFVAQLFWSKFNLKYVCALFIKTEVVWLLNITVWNSFVGIFLELSNMISFESFIGLLITSWCTWFMFVCNILLNIHYQDPIYFSTHCIHDHIMHVCCKYPSLFVSYFDCEKTVVDNLYLTRNIHAHRSCWIGCTIQLFIQVLVKGKQ
jgi:hypothetical protein